MALAVQPGERLPLLEGEFLTGTKAELPGAARGKLALYALGFSYDSRFPVEAWVARFKKDFGSDGRMTFFEVPVIGGMGMLGKPFIDRGMRNGTPKEFHGNVLTVYGGAGKLKRAFAVRDERNAVLVLADGAGVVRWTHEGMFDETRYQEMRSVALRLLQEGSSSQR